MLQDEFAFHHRDGRLTDPLGPAAVRTTVGEPFTKFTLTWGKCQSAFEIHVSCVHRRGALQHASSRDLRTVAVRAISFLGQG
jgi:hypothetical protein